MSINLPPDDQSPEDRIGGLQIDLLVAYADGVLPPAQARDVEAALRHSPEAQEALSLMRQSAAAVRHAFDEPLGAPVPERLRSLFDRPRDARGPLSRSLLPLAASIAALIVGLGTGYLMGQPAETGSDVRLAEGPAAATSSAFSAALLQALATNRATLSYGDAAGGAAGTVTLLATIETSFGVTCREFHHVGRRYPAGSAVTDAPEPGDTAELGLACQRPDGGWEVTVLSSPSP